MHCKYLRLVEHAHTAVVMIHGILGSPAHFRRFERLVPQDMSVVNLVLDGHGKSAADFSRTSMDKWKFQVQSTVKFLAKTHERILILGHSMGTLLALDAARQNEKVKALFLLAPPLRICVKPSAVINGIRVALNRIGEDNPVAMALRDCTGVQLSRNPLVYIGWIPRFWELLRESRAARAGFEAMELPCRVYLSRKDELVSVRSAKHLNENIELVMLENSTHSYYPPEDFAILRRDFEVFLKKYGAEGQVAGMSKTKASMIV